MIYKELLEKEMMNCCTCSRELWRVLFGGGTTLASLLVSLGGWYHCDFHRDKIKICCGYSVSPFRVFITAVAGSLVPQIFMSFALSSALAASVLRQRVHKCKREMANKICTMVVWIRMDEATYKSLFSERPQSSLWGLFPAGIEDHKMSGPEQAPGTDDALFFKEGKSVRALPAEQHTSTGINPPTSELPPPQNNRYYYLCSQSWDPNNLLWKEAMLNTDGVLPELDELKIIQSRTTWESLIVSVQTLGYLVSFLSRFAYGRGARVSAVEVMSAWISIALVVQLLIIPRLATYSNRGICLCLSGEKLKELVRYYEQKREQDARKLNWQTLLVLVLCLLFLFALFLILIPPLVYYYYRLSNNALTFTSLIPFAIISAIAIMAFVLTLILPPHEVIFAFVAFPFLNPPARSQSSKYMPVISSAILFVGLSCYSLAVIDTAMNWHHFRVRDCYFSSFIIPHIGS